MILTLKLPFVENLLPRSLTMESHQFLKGFRSGKHAHSSAGVVIKAYGKYCSVERASRCSSNSRYAESSERIKNTKASRMASCNTRGNVAIRIPIESFYHANRVNFVYRAYPQTCIRFHPGASPMDSMDSMDSMHTTALCFNSSTQEEYAPIEGAHTYFFHKQCSLVDLDLLAHLNQFHSMRLKNTHRPGDKLKQNSPASFWPTPLPTAHMEPDSLHCALLQIGASKICTCLPFFVADIASNHGNVLCCSAAPEKELKPLHEFMGSHKTRLNENCTVSNDLILITTLTNSGVTILGMISAVPHLVRLHPIDMHMHHSCTTMRCLFDTWFTNKETKTRWFISQSAPNKSRQVEFAASPVIAQRR